MASERRAAVRRIAIAALALGAIAFAVEGGEFGTIDLIRQRRESTRIARSIDSLKRVVDSLKQYQNAIDHDPATQERIAREVFGMVRGEKELLYRFTDSASKAARP